MKKIKLLILFFVLSYSITFSQERFFGLYPGWTINYSLETETGYNMFGLDYSSEECETPPILSKTDLYGNLLNSQSYISDTLAGFTFYTSKSYSFHDDYYFASGVYKEYFKDYILNPIIMYFNTETNYADSITDLKQYFSGRSSHIMFHRELEDVIQVFGVSQYSLDWNTKTFFGVYNKTDRTFTYKDYTKPNHCVMTPYQALPTEDGGYIIACEQDMTLYDPEKVKACILKTDSAGNEKWRYVIPGDTIETVYYGNVPAATYRPRIFNAPDGNYFVVWTDPNVITSMSMGANPQNTIWVCKLTDNGESCTISEKKDLRAELDYFNRYWYITQDSYQDEQGNMYVLLQSDGGYISALAKIHSNGTGAWLRTFRCFPDDDAEFNQTMLYGFTPTSDGGFMLTGEFRSFASTMFPGGIQSALAIKTDSCGCFDTEGCNDHCADSYSEQFIYMAGANIYPNPASDKITVSFEYNGAETEFVYKIYSLNGQLLQEGTFGTSVPLQNGTSGTSVPLQNGNLKIDISDLPSGYYTIQFRGGGKIFTAKFVKE